MRGSSSAADKTADQPSAGRSPRVARGKKAKKRGGSRAGNVLSLLGAFVATSVALGLLVAGVLLPVTGLTGGGIKQGVKMFNNIPASFAENALSQQSKILAKDGSVIATPYDENRIVVPSDQIPKVMKDAQVAIEDERFYEHGALDQRGIARAIGANLFSSGTQGASTLTQQYVKVADQRQALDSGNKKAAEDAVAQTGSTAYIRKLKQLKAAVDLEKTHTKDQILTSYLNLVYFGDQQYGIEAAARHYFGHSAKDLTLAEAATLAGVVNLPGATDPIHNPKAAVTRRNIVLNKMAAQGFVTRAQAQAAVNSPLKTHVQNFSSGCQTSKYPYYCDYVTNWLAGQPSLGKTRKERIGKLQTGGLTIQTSLDPKQTQALDSAIKKKVPASNGADVQSSGVIVQPGTGLVTAMAQNTTYDVAGTDLFHTAVNYANSGFPIGSTAKLFAIVEAMRQGKSADSTVDVPAMNGTDGDGAYYAFNSKNFPGPCGQKRGTWNVHNDEPEPSGPMKYREATGKSVNTAFASLVASLGACKVHDEFQRLGVMAKSSADGSLSPITKDPSNIVLGAGSSTAVMMANAYATIAADGKYCEARPVIAIKQPNGKNLPLDVQACKSVLTADQARNVAEVFHGPLDSSGTAAVAKLADGRDAFGKTGTEGVDKNSWFVGSTKQLTTAIWVGRAGSGQPPLRNLTLAGHYYDGYIFGADIAAPVWKDVMDTVSDGMPKEKFPTVDSGKTQVAVPDVSGKTEGEARSILTKLKLKVKVQRENGGSGKSGTVTRTDPAVASQVDENGTITIYVKN